MKTFQYHPIQKCVDCDRDIPTYEAFNTAWVNDDHKMRCYDCSIEQSNKDNNTKKESYQRKREFLSSINI